VTFQPVLKQNLKNNVTMRSRFMFPDKDQLQVIVNNEMNLRVGKQRGVFPIAG
jgi:hypothetical protein